MLTYYLRLAAKSALATPAMTALTVGAMALGIAVPTALISIYHVFAQNPIPHKSDRLFNVRVESWETGSEFFNVLPGDPPKHMTYRDMRGLMRSDIPRHESGVASATIFVFPGDPALKPFRGVTQLVHADFFPMFDVPFKYGAGWNQAADESRERVVVLSDTGNRKLFGGENSVGRRLRLGDVEFTVVGVMDHWEPTPQYFDVINNAMGTTRELFLPFDLIRDQAVGLVRTGDADSYGTVDTNDPNALYDLSEATWIQYWVELDPAQRADYASFVDDYAMEQKRLGRFPRPLNNRVTPLMEWMKVRAVVPPATVGLVVISLLFLIVCCFNLTSLLLAKFLSKSGVLGIHRALGAPRSSVFLQRLLECELVGVAGGIAGTLLAAGALALINRWLPAGFVRADLFGADLYSLLVALALALVAGLLSGIYPAWRACRIPPALQLKVQ